MTTVTTKSAYMNFSKHLTPKCFDLVNQQHTGVRKVK